MSSCSRLRSISNLTDNVSCFQAFKVIFTTSSSACEDSQNTPGNKRPAKRPRKVYTSTRANVASLIGLETVTPRAIAYIAVQVSIFSPSSSISGAQIIFSSGLPCQTLQLGGWSTLTSATSIFMQQSSTFLRPRWGPSLKPMPTSYFHGGIG